MWPTLGEGLVALAAAHDDERAALGLGRDKGSLRRACAARARRLALVLPDLLLLLLGGAIPCGVGVRAGERGRCGVGLVRGRRVGDGVSAVAEVGPGGVGAAADGRGRDVELLVLLGQADALAAIGGGRRERRERRERRKGEEEARQRELALQQRTRRWEGEWTHSASRALLRSSRTSLLEADTVLLERVKVEVVAAASSSAPSAPSWA